MVILITKDKGGKMLIICRNHDGEIVYDEDWNELCPLCVAENKITRLEEALAADVVA